MISISIWRQTIVLWFLPGTKLRPKQHDKQWFQWGSGRSCGWWWWWVGVSRRDTTYMPCSATHSPCDVEPKPPALISLQECAERHGTVVGMSSVDQLEQHISSVGSRCAKFFSDVLAAVQIDFMFCSPMALLFRRRLKSPPKVSPS